MPDETPSIFDFFIGPPFRAELDDRTGQLWIGGTAEIAGRTKMQVRLVVERAEIPEYTAHLRALLRALETADTPASKGPRLQ